MKIQMTVAQKTDQSQTTSEKGADGKVNQKTENITRLVLRDGGNNCNVVVAYKEGQNFELGQKVTVEIK